MVYLSTQGIKMHTNNTLFYLIISFKDFKPPLYLRLPSSASLPQQCTVHPLPLIILLRHLQLWEPRGHNASWGSAGDDGIFREIRYTAMVAEEVFVEREEAVYRRCRGAEDGEDSGGEDGLDFYFQQIGLHR